MSYWEIAKKMLGGLWEQVQQVGMGPVYAGLILAAIFIPLQIWAAKKDREKRREDDKKIIEEAIGETLGKTFERFEELEPDAGARLSLRSAMASINNSELADEILTKMEENDE